jgi:hypothetical protein
MNPLLSHEASIEASISPVSGGWRTKNFDAKIEFSRKRVDYY